MWKIQHNEGAREINELHVPVNRDIRLTLTSEDVIHDFYVPAFRTKTDVLPGRYTTEWFRPTKIGAYHIFCAEYCGTKHSGMIGTVYVMSQTDYNDWLGKGSGEGSMAEQGQSLFNQLGCGNCHPSTVQAVTGVAAHSESERGFRHYRRPEGRITRMARADESYIRESVLNPERAKIVAGYENIMPTFKGLITEDGLVKLVEYVKSLGPRNGWLTTPPAPTQTTGNPAPPVNLNPKPGPATPGGPPAPAGKK